MAAVQRSGGGGSHLLKEYARYSEVQQLAHKIATLQNEKSFRSVAVLSFLQGEGRTLFCAALATAYQDAFKTKALLVDTTTLQNEGSFVLKKFVGTPFPTVDVISIQDIRDGNQGFQGTMDETDLMLVKKVVNDRSGTYGLVVFDTSPLKARNRNNLDAQLVARTCEASILVVSRKSFEDLKLPQSIKLLEDPSFHLLGMVSNEAFS